MSVDAPPEIMPLRQRFTRGLEAPICLTWELTYACNLACVHCLSSSGRRDPLELSPAEARQIVDELAAMKVFYVNIGGGEPMLRPDFFDLVGYAVENKVGVKFSTNGTRLTAERARRLAGMDYVDVQISIDGALASTNDAVRGEGSFAAARTAMDNLAAANFGQFKISVVVTRENVTQLDEFAAIAESYGAQLRLDALPALGSRRRDVGCTASDRRTATDAVPLALGPSRCPDRRLLLPSFGTRGAPRRSQPLWCGKGRVPDRPGRGRLRLPVRHRQGIPGRQRAPAGRLRRCVARVRPFRVTARAAECGGVRIVRVLRRLPGWLHGGQVLHRYPARRARPRVCVRPRRRGTGRARRDGAAGCGHRALQGRRARDAHPGADAGPLPDGSARA